MRTLLTTITFLIFATFSYSQTYIAANTSQLIDYNREYYSNTKPDHARTITFTGEILQKTDFNYTRLLEASENATTTYSIGNEIYRKKELLKVFRKGARRSENIAEFKHYLQDRNPKFLDQLSERDTEAIFDTFREGTLHAYIDNLPKHIF